MACEILQDLCQDLANIFWKGQIVNILDLGAHGLCCDFSALPGGFNLPSGSLAFPSQPLCSALSGCSEVHGASYSGVERPSVPGQLQDKAANEVVKAKIKDAVFGGFVVVAELLSRVQLFETLWTAAHQASLSFTVSQGFTQVPVK